MSKPMVAIVGRQNVGKSTLLNRLAGRRIAIVEDLPGTTRDRLTAGVSWLDKEFTVIDTGGVEAKGSSSFTAEINRQVGIAIDEADLILFHPYDRWGYSNMPAEADDRYLRYIVARLAACRNVWWSLANEFDFMKNKSMADWDRFFRIVQESDPYHHLRSIHNGTALYDHSKPWVTHVSLQSSDLEKARELVATYRKPVIYDECKYEGNIPRRWGNISARELVRRFWLGTVSGAYVGHGETYLDPNDVLWWSKGGVLRGESPPRIAFLRRILESGPAEGLDNLSTYYLGAGQEGRYYLFYFDLNQPAEYTFSLAKGARYRADIIDPWEMTITPVEGAFEGQFTMKLPGRPFLAVRFQKVK